LIFVIFLVAPSNIIFLREINIRHTFVFKTYMTRIQFSIFNFQFSILIALISLFPFLTAKAQVNPKDSIIATSLAGLSYTLQIPGGNLKNRFGLNSNAGLDFMYKTKHNLLIGIDGHFIFGGNLKEDSILKPISTADGNIIASDGSYADVRLYERGFSFAAKFGKLFPVFGPNKNCGIIFLAGAGFLQHKIRIEVTGNNVPQLNSDMKKGYDRLTNGFAINEFVGYFYLGNRRLINFFGGFDFMQAWTKNRRAINFDTMMHDGTNRLDVLSGIRFGWVIPFYKKVPNQYYYY